MGYIYVFVDLIENKLVYVGQHNGVKKYYVTGGKTMRKMLKAFPNRFERVIIEYLPIKELDNAEEFWITMFGTWVGYGNGGYNITRNGKHTNYYFKVDERLFFIPYNDDVERILKKRISKLDAYSPAVSFIKLRINKKLSIKEAADLIGISPKKYDRFEKDLDCPSIELETIVNKINDLFC